MLNCNKLNVEMHCMDAKKIEGETTKLQKTTINEKVYFTNNSKFIEFLLYDDVVLHLYMYCFT